jgi:hypothetical protein
MSKGENFKKVKAYIAACKEVSRQLENGEKRENLSALATEKDGAKYWENWIGNGNTRLKRF